MQVYFIYVPEDEDFVNQLTDELHQRGFRVTHHPSDEELTSATRTDAVLIALSESSAQNQAFVDELENLIPKSRAQIIVLRIGTISQTPPALKGILPLDFSNPDLYEEAFQTLLQDLEPQTAKLQPISILPDNVEQLLQSESADERIQAIQQLSDLRTTLTDEQIALAERLLRDLVFKDNNNNVKQLARVTLQLLLTPSSDEQTVEEDEQDTVEFVPTHTTTETSTEEVTPIIIRPKESSAHSQLVVFSQQWWWLPILGICLALSNAIYLEHALGALPIGLVWLVLPWFNVIIRDGGRLDWKMPAPLVGNALIAGFLCIISVLLLGALGTISILDAFALVLSCVVYGVLIGWMSTFHSPY